MSAISKGSEIDTLSKYNLNLNLSSKEAPLEWYVTLNKSQIKNGYDNSFPIEDANFIGLSFWSYLVQDLNINTAKVKFLLRLPFKILVENTEIIIL